MHTAGEISNYQGSDEAAKIPHGVNQSNGRSGRRLAQKQSGHCPEHRVNTIKWTACQRRSPVRSECQPFTCCVMNAATYGKAASSVTLRSLLPESRFRIVGSQ